MIIPSLKTDMKLFHNVVVNASERFDTFANSCEICSVTDMQHYTHMRNCENADISQTEHKSSLVRILFLYVSDQKVTVDMPSPK